MNIIQMPIPWRTESIAQIIKARMARAMQSWVSDIDMWFTQYVESLPPALPAWVEFYIPVERRKSMIRRIRRIRAISENGNFRLPQIEARVREDFKDLSNDLQSGLSLLLASRPDYTGPGF
jgi:hypothetical protein